jgi:hypothetical protein
MGEIGFQTRLATGRTGVSRTTALVPELEFRGLEIGARSAFLSQFPERWDLILRRTAQ